MVICTTVCRASCISMMVMWRSNNVNSSPPPPPPPGQNGHHFADDIFRCVFVNESFAFWLQFHWNLFLRVQWTITQHRFNWTNFFFGDPIHWHIYAALGGDELIQEEASSQYNFLRSHLSGYNIILNVTIHDISVTPMLMTIRIWMWSLHAFFLKVLN